MAAMVATMATKNDTPSREGLLAAVVTPAPLFPRPPDRVEARAIYQSRERNPMTRRGGRSAFQHRRSEPAPLRKRQRARVGGQHLDAHVVRTGVVVGADAGPDRIDVAPRDDGVDQAIAAAVTDVLVREAEGGEVVHVVRKSEVHGHVRAGYGARGRRIGLENGRLLGREQRTRADDLPS